MRSTIAAVFLLGLLAPAAASANLVTGNAAPARDRAVLLALNPQPEPPGKAKVKRIYSGKDDSRRNKDLHPIKMKPLNAPATKY